MRFTPKKNAGASLTLCLACEPEGPLLPTGAEEAVRLAVEATLRYEGFPYATEVSVTFCDPDTIRRLNAEYRERDAETDVLSFPMYGEDEEPLADEAPLLLGDIVLNPARAAEQAAELGNTLLREIAFLSVHSTLHLLGYDHEGHGEEAEEDMYRRQREIMKTFEIPEEDKP